MLISALKTNDPKDTGYVVKQRAATALGKIKGKQAMDALIQALSDKDNPNSVRMAAERAIGEINDL